MRTLDLVMYRRQLPQTAVHYLFITEKEKADCWKRDDP
jgi:hypothetical protein